MSKNTEAMRLMIAQIHAKTADIFELAAKNPELLRIIEASTISGRWETGKVATDVRDKGFRIECRRVWLKKHRAVQTSYRYVPVARAKAA